MRRIGEIIAELEELEPLRQALKARAMIYQADLKEQAAEMLGLPLDTFYNYHYESWACVARQLHVGLY